MARLKRCIWAISSAENRTRAIAAPSPFVKASMLLAIACGPNSFPGGASATMRQAPARTAFQSSGGRAVRSFCASLTLTPFAPMLDVPQIQRAASAGVTSISAIFAMSFEASSPLRAVKLSR